MGTDSSSQQSRRHGFSLVESAIVLAVVGLVLGGIWVAASAVIDNYRIKRIAEGLILAGNNLQNNLSQRDVSYLVDTQGNVNGYVFIIDYCISSKVFPDDFYSGNKIVLPFFSATHALWSVANGGDISCYLVNISGYKIEIDVATVTKDICLKLTSYISTKYHDNSSLSEIVVAGIDNVPVGSWLGTNYTNWPLSPSGNQCNAQFPAHIRLRFIPKN